VRQLIAEGVQDLTLEALLGAGWMTVVQTRASASGEAASQGPRAVRLRYVQRHMGPMEHLVLSPVAEVTQ